MSKPLALVLFGLSLVFPTVLVAQEPSTVFSGVNACLANLASEGQRLGLEVDDSQTAMVLVLDPSPKKLSPLLPKMSSCLKSVLRNVSVVNFKNFKTGGSDKGRVWYLPIEGKYITCSSHNASNKIEPKNTLGGYGEKRDWFVVLVKCDVKAKFDPSEVMKFW